MSAKSREKCLKEIKLLEKMNHESIIQYLDSYIDPETDELVILLEWSACSFSCFLVITRAEGGDLKKLIRKVKKAEKAFSEAQVYRSKPNALFYSLFQIWKYASEITNGLLHMHERRVMHRDLKVVLSLFYLPNIFSLRILCSHEQIQSRLDFFVCYIYCVFFFFFKLGDLGLSRYFTEQTMEAFSKVFFSIFIIFLFLLFFGNNIFSYFLLNVSFMK